jgi:hypothetical protein
MISVQIGYSETKKLFQLNFYIVAEMTPQDKYQLDRIQQNTKKCAKYIGIDTFVWDPAAKKVFMTAFGGDDDQRRPAVFLLGDLVEKFGYTMQDIQLLVSLVSMDLLHPVKEQN